MAEIKYMRIQNQDGTYSEPIPISPPAENVKMANGQNLEYVVSDLKQKNTDLSVRMNTLKTIVGSPLKTSIIDDTLDVNRIYVYVGSQPDYIKGNWYYHNGDFWESGGVYNSVAVDTDKTLTVADQAADAAAVGQQLEVLNNDLLENSRNFQSSIETLTLTKAAQVDFQTLEAIVESLTRNKANRETVQAIQQTIDNLNALEELDIRFSDEASELSWWNKTTDTLLGTITITGTGGGGGGGGGNIGIKLRMTFNNQSAFTTIYGEPDTNISFNWSSIYDDQDSQETGNGNVVININGVRVKQILNIPQGTFTYDVSENLKIGLNNIQAILTDNTGSTRNLRWTITAISLSLTSNFDPYTPYYYPGNVGFTYTATTGGNFEKTVHFELDGIEQTETNTTSGGLSIKQFSGLDHGSHNLRVWVTASVNNTQLISNELYFNFIYLKTDISTPVVVSSFNQTIVKQFDNVTIPYVIWDPNYIPGVSQVDSSSNRRYTVLEKVDYGPVGNHYTVPVFEEISINPDRSVQYWTLRFKETNDYRLRIKATNQIYKEFFITVESSQLDNIQNLTNALQCEFTATGRLNSQSDYATWSSFGYNASFSSNFDWVNGGWKTDENGSSLMRIKAGDKVTIPLHLFGTDFKTTGKSIKIIFRCRNSVNYESQILKCYSQNEGANGIGLRLYANKAIFNSLSEEIEVPYKENTYIEMDLVVYTGNPNPMILWYLQGIPSAVRMYKPSSDRFNQTNAQNISIGSTDCDVDIYLIKTYNRVLNEYEVLNNFIADAPNTDEMIDRYQRNDIYDSYHNIVLDKLKTKYMLIKSDERKYDYYLPSRGKEDKLKDINNPPTTAYIEYVDPNNSRNNFKSNNVGMGIQGTSSLEYASSAININLSFDKNGFNYDNGLQASGFSIHENSIPVNFFCLKADVASSESANNVLLADEYNEFDPYVSEPQLDELLEQANKANYIIKATTDTNSPSYNRDNLILELKNAGFINKIRGTIEGEPIIVFHQDSNQENPRNTSPQFYGKFNMNNDKVNYAVFGEDRNKYPQQSCVEFLTNESPYCSFKSADFTSEDSKGNKLWETGFEFRFPKKPNATDVSNLERVISWVNSTDTSAATNQRLSQSVTYEGITYTEDTADYRLAKFKNEFNDYFILSSTIWFYLFTERYLMVDNRAKNVFMGTDDGIHWHFKNDYDNDTALGINNRGQLKHSYSVEYKDGSNSYGGESSVLWINLELCFSNEIQAMAVRQESQGAFNYQRLKEKFEKHQKTWPEAIWIEDMFKKYIRPYTDPITKLDGTKDTKEDKYLPMLLGNKELQRDWFTFYRDRYLSSKYRGPICQGDEISMRMTVPTTNTNVANVVDASGNIVNSSITAVRPNQNLTITPYADMYVLVYYGAKSSNQYRTQRVNKGETITIEAPTFSDTGSGGAEAYIENASLISDIGDLSACYLSALDLSKATRLQNIQIGNKNVSGYQNGSWGGSASLIFNSLLIKTIDLTGMINLQNNIDILNCAAIEKVYAENTRIPAVSLAQNSKINTLKLPSTITYLTLKRTNKLQTLTLQGYSYLDSIIVEVLPQSLDNQIADIISRSSNLTAVRAIDMNWQVSGDGKKLFDVLLKTVGLDDSGTRDSKGINRYVTGSAAIETITATRLAQIKNYLPKLQVTYGTQTFYVRFLNYDGSLFYNEPVNLGQDALSPPQAPTKPSNDQYNYYFDSWAESFTNVRENKTIHPVFEARKRHYNIYFYKESYENPTHTLYYSISGDEQGDSSAAIEYGNDVNMNSIPSPVEDPQNYLNGGWVVVCKKGVYISNGEVLPDDFNTLNYIETSSINNVEGTIYCFPVISHIDEPDPNKTFGEYTWGNLKYMFDHGTVNDYNIEIGDTKTVKLNTKQVIEYMVIEKNNNSLVLFPTILPDAVYQINKTKKKSYCYTINGVTATSNNYTYNYTGTDSTIELKPAFSQLNSQNPNFSTVLTGKPLLTEIEVTPQGGSATIYDFTINDHPSGLTIQGTTVWNEAGFTELKDDAVIKIPVSDGATIKIKTFLVGSSWNNGGWFYSDIRKIAQDEFFYELPGLLQSLIIPRLRKSTIGNYIGTVSYTYTESNNNTLTTSSYPYTTINTIRSNNSNYFNRIDSVNYESEDQEEDFDSNNITKRIGVRNNSNTYITSLDKIWLLSNTEISSYAKNNSINKELYIEQNTDTFSIFTTNDNRKIPRSDNQNINKNNARYWLSSTYYDYYNSFGAVSKDGEWEQNCQAYTMLPAAFAFEIGN